MAQTAELNIEQELERREAAQRDMQIKIDLDELSQRESAVEEGRSRLIAPDEFWGTVEKAGV